MTESSFAHGLIGTTLDGRYRLDAVLGEGGMGAVFRATHVALERRVAIKLLKPHLAADPKALERFSREAKATLRVDSPHAVKLLDFGITPRGDYYMALEYLDGRTVQRELEVDGPFAPARVAHIARQALHALGAAHAMGLIHRDVKPDNLLLMRAGSDGDYTKVLDFGVAKLMQGTGDPGLLALTGDGMVFGTPEFMSPEQACGQPLDGRSDLYSLAVTLFVMLTGTTLFEADMPIAWLTHHVRTPPPPLAAVRPQLAAFPELDALLQRCLAKQRDARPASAVELAALFAELEPTLARATARGPHTAGTRTMSRASSFVQALRENAPVSTGITASTLAVPARAGAPVVADASPAPVVAPRRRWWVAGVATASLVGVVIALAVPRIPSRSTSISGSAAGPDVHPHTHEPAALVTATTVGVPVTAPAASGADVAPDTVAATVSDRTATDVGRPPRRPAPRSPSAPRKPSSRAVAGAPPDAAGSTPAVRAGARSEAEDHLRNAEEALRRDNPLRQLAEADLALRADPHSVRARFLLGDALIKSGDLDHGCRYLGAISQLLAARDRARAAGCPGD